MTPMCDVNTNQFVGWGTGDISCDGATITISYIDLDGVDQGSAAPANWSPCRPYFNSITIAAIVQLTQAEYDALVSYDPNTLYLIVEP
jgi:alpha-D-ribose 1-methylphosphonate 5-phosphate C-P lyase